MQITTIDIRDVTVLNDLIERFPQVTQREIDAAARRLNGTGETFLGFITKPATQALFTLATRLDSTADMLRAQSALALDENEQSDLEQQAGIKELLGGVIKNMFWVEACFDLGIHKTLSLSLGEGWRLFEKDQRRGFPQGLLLGGMPPSD